MTEPDLTTGQAADVVASKTLPKITKEGLDARIGGSTYLHHDELTICILTMVNGFTVVGTAAPASKGNYDEKAGERIAYDKAFAQLWPLEGYLLKEKLWREAVAEHKAVEDAKAAEGGN